MFMMGVLLTACGANTKTVETVSEDTTEIVAPNDTIHADVRDGIPMVIDFYATWCTPCKQIEPEFIEIEKEYCSKVNFLRIDIDKQPEIAKEYNVDAVPTFVLLDADDNELYRIVGADASALRERVKELANY